VVLGFGQIALYLGNGNFGLHPYGPLGAAG
jgi:hypothetical protein